MHRLTLSFISSPLVGSNVSLFAWKWEGHQEKNLLGLWEFPSLAWIYRSVGKKPQSHPHSFPTLWPIVSFITKNISDVWVFFFAVRQDFQTFNPTSLGTKVDVKPVSVCILFSWKAFLWLNSFQPPDVMWAVSSSLTCYWSFPMRSRRYSGILNEGNLWLCLVVQYCFQERKLDTFYAVTLPCQHHDNESISGSSSVSCRINNKFQTYCK